jgi:hypothetical protein
VPGKVSPTDYLRAKYFLFSELSSMKIRKRGGGGLAFHALIC